MSFHKRLQKLIPNLVGCEVTVFGREVSDHFTAATDWTVALLMVAEDEVLQCLHMSLQIADHEEEQFELVDTWFCSSEDLLYSHVSDILDECDVAEDTQHLYKH